MAKGKEFYAQGAKDSKPDPGLPAMAARVKAQRAAAADAARLNTEAQDAKAKAKNTSQPKATPAPAVPTDVHEANPGFREMKERVAAGRTAAAEIHGALSELRRNPPAPDAETAPGTTTPTPAPSSPRGGGR